MLPFVFLDESKLGPFHPFGLCVAIGFFVWDWAVMRFAARRGFERDDFRALTIWVCATGIFTAWLIDAIFYHPPGNSVTSTLLSFQGFSSTGGFFGAFAGGLVWRSIRIRKIDGKLRIEKRATPMPLLPATEVFVATWPIGWAWGRVGCSLIHDHPGIIVPKGTLASLLAVAWPRGPEDGVHHVLGPLHVVTGGSDARFDLGLLELFILAAISAGFALTWKRDLKLGTYTIVATLVYGPLRFLLDFLRAQDIAGGDLRHGGLTFAQYFSIGITLIGLYLLAQRLRRGGKVAAAAATIALLLLPTRAEAAPSWVDRPITIPRLVFAGDVGIGIAHRDVPNRTGAGLNIEGGFGITDTVDLGLRTGVRFGDAGRATQADTFGRTLWTETYGVGGDTVANPEARLRWAAYSGSVAEVGLDWRLFLPVEQGTRFGLSFGVPLAFHIASVVRIDTGVYMPTIFNDDVSLGLSFPLYVWIQPTNRLWLGPMSSFRADVANAPSSVLLGFGLGYQVANPVDLKTWLLFPNVDRDGGAADFGLGFGLQFRIGE